MLGALRMQMSHQCGKQVLWQGNSYSKFRQKIPIELAEISQAFLVARFSSKKVGRGQQGLGDSIEDRGKGQERMT